MHVSNQFVYIQHYFQAWSTTINSHSKTLQAVWEVSNVFIISLYKDDWCSNSVSYWSVDRCHNCYSQRKYHSGVTARLTTNHSMKIQKQSLSLFNQIGSSKDDFEDLEDYNLQAIVEFSLGVQQQFLFGIHQWLVVVGSIPLKNQLHKSLGGKHSSIIINDRSGKTVGQYWDTVKTGCKVATTILLVPAFTRIQSYLLGLVVLPLTPADNARSSASTATNTVNLVSCVVCSIWEE